ncbi:MAG: hypothetical protein WCF77_04595 [Minisyncoccia bacterium]
MKVLLALCICACALAQPTKPVDVPRLLTERGVKSARAFADVYQKFKDAASAIPSASEDMENAIFCAKRPSAICATSPGAAFRDFERARFDLRFRHFLAVEAYEEMCNDILNEAFMKPSPLALSNRENQAIQAYLETARSDLRQSFAAAERRWQKTWRWVEKFVDRRRLG